MEDIQLMHSLGVNTYRFSISWTRILPRGRFGDVNPIGIAFYNSLIDAMLEKGIQPFVTINHFDIPQELEDRYGAWLSTEIREDFVHFAEVCFKAFGDRVKYWATFNEPSLMVKFSYIIGRYPPHRCSRPFENCSSGDSTVEPYVAMHNIVLSHAIAVDVYQKNYQVKQGGVIGIVVNSKWFEPLHNLTVDIAAVQRALAFEVGWVIDPLFYGDYPLEMHKVIATKLPKFTPKEKHLLLNKLDFFGVNHCNSIYAKDCMFSSCNYKDFEANARVVTTGYRQGVPIGAPTAMPNSYVFPEGMEKLLIYIAKRYNNTPIYVTENGYAQGSNAKLSTEALLNDTERVDYLDSYLKSLSLAMRKGVDIRGYFIWSLLDNFEWLYGFSLRFGIFHVDFNTQERTPKLSAKWYKKFLHSGMFINKISAPLDDDM